jgi:hypothetical protein
VWSAPCKRRRGARVSWLSLKTKVDGLSVMWRQNHWGGLSELKTTRTIFSNLASKPEPTVFSGLASKPVAMVSSSLTSKPVVGFLVDPQNYGGGGFSGLGLKTSSYGSVI